MGEGFQFSSPYKWRCSKRFYRLFVYCSWLLIARDNSTGFTIQWGRINTGSRGDRWAGFPRGFNSALAVLVSSAGFSSDANNYSWCDSVINFNNGGVTIRTHSEDSGRTSSWCMYCAFGFT